MVTIDLIILGHCKSTKGDLWMKIFQEVPVSLSLSLHRQGISYNILAIRATENLNITIKSLKKGRDLNLSGILGHKLS